jgi:hypothetical protein
MSKKVKRVIAGLVAVLIVAIWTFPGARADYVWAKNVIRERTSEGWTLAVTQDNYVSPVRPWTLFKAPVTGLWFARPGGTWEVLDDAERPRGPIVFAPILHVSYDYDRTEAEEYVEFFDLATGKSAFAPHGTTLQDLVDAGADFQRGVPLSGLQWREYDPGTPGEKLTRYFQNQRRAR